MTETKSSNPKLACVDCHFLVYAMKYRRSNSDQYSLEVVDKYYRNYIKEKCYNYSESTRIPEECDYSRGYNNEKAPVKYITGLKCFKGVWPSEEFIELDLRRIPRTPDIKTCRFLLFVPKYREKAFDEVVAVERNDCFFYEYTSGMRLKTAEKLEERAAQNKSTKKPLELETAKPSEPQEKKDLPLYKKTPENAKWQDLTMAFPNHLEEKVDIFFNGNKDPDVSLKDLGFVKGSATKEFKPRESLTLLKKFAKNEDIYLFPPTDKNERTNLHAQVKSLRNVLKQCFGINGDPVPANEKGGYRLLFKAYCYDLKEKQEVDTYIDSLKEYFSELKTEVNNTGEYRDADKIRALKESILTFAKEITQRIPNIRIEDVVCTKCDQKIPTYILNSENIQILCEDCTPEPSNEYQSSIVTKYKKQDISRNESDK
ncbi:MAG: hypothetical protein ACYSTS_16115 [Planctomycetota bacterium]|jgi:hypothetical protein